MQGHWNYSFFSETSTSYQRLAPLLSPGWIALEPLLVFLPYPQRTNHPANIRTMLMFCHTLLGYGNPSLNSLTFENGSKHIRMLIAPLPNYPGAPVLT
jgi:hypothetical protein